MAAIRSITGSMRELTTLSTVSAVIVDDSVDTMLLSFRVDDSVDTAAEAPETCLRMQS